MKQPFSKNISIAEPFHLDYVIHFYIPEKGLSGPVFTIKILVADYSQILLLGRLLKYYLAIFQI